MIVDQEDNKKIKRKGDNEKIHGSNARKLHGSARLLEKREGRVSWRKMAHS
jgi:hypothetical protein